MSAHILAVDGDPERLAWLVEVLEGAGYGVTPAATFESARRFLKAEQFDALVTNLRLQAYNGLHLAFFSQMSGPMPAVVLADRADASSQHEADELGARYVTLPITDDHLEVIIRTALRKRVETNAPPVAVPRDCRPDGPG